MDENYEDWKVGDIVAWNEQEDPEKKGRRFKIKRIREDFIIWDNFEGNEDWTRCTNLVRTLRVATNDA